MSRETRGPDLQRETDRARKASATPELLAGFFGLVWFLFNGGARVIDPRSTAWLMCGDWSWHHLGWLFYRRAAWQFPLGVIADYPDPIGSVTGYTDSIPWLALVLKALPLPNADFQYLGPWMALSFALSGYWAARIVRLFTASSAAIFLGSVPFVITPILLLRTGHAALTAHWTLLCAFELYFRPDQSQAHARATWHRGLALCAFVAGVHPYLLAMVVPLLFALLYRSWRIDRLWPGHRAAIAGAQLVLVAFGCWTLLGYFNGTGPTSGGYGVYVADLFTFVNSMGWSRFVPQIPSAPGEIEGFGYLGLGVLSLLVFVGVRAFRTRTVLNVRSLTPLLVASGLLFLHALSLRVTVAGHRLIDSSFTFFTLAKVFQSSGRFIWPLYYLLIVLAVVGTLHFTRSNERLQVAVLSAAVLLQLLELGPKGTRFGQDGFPVVVPASSTWLSAVGAYRTIKVFPADAVAPFKAHSEFHSPIPLGYLAYRLGMTVDTAALARGSSHRAQAYIAQNTASVLSGELDPRAIYIVLDLALPAFRNGSRCGKLDGYNVCVAGGNQDGFARSLVSTSS